MQTRRQVFKEIRLCAQWWIIIGSTVNILGALCVHSREIFTSTSKSKNYDENGYDHNLEATYLALNLVIKIPWGTGPIGNKSVHFRPKYLWWRTRFWSLHHHCRVQISTLHAAFNDESNGNFRNDIALYSNWLSKISHLKVWTRKGIGALPYTTFRQDH